MNLLTGIVLKLGGQDAAVLALFMLKFFGLMLVLSLFYLFRAAGFSSWVSFGASAVFSLIPSSIYFEHLYLYTYPTAALLCLAAALFHHGLRRQSFWTWFAFFATCAAIGWLRSTFHLAWFVAMLGLAVWFTSRSGRLRVLAAAAVPAALLLALYLKNLIVFGVFGALTAGPLNLTTVTLRRMPTEVRESWIREGKLSPFAAVDPYSGPRQYLPYFATSQNDEWPPMMNTLEKPSVGSPNFNHWFFLEANPRRREDALYYLKERPLEYAGTVMESLKRIFQPSTQWHPSDKAADAPHFQHRQVLGPYEELYNGVVHQVPVAPVGLYVFLPFGCAWVLVRARRMLRLRSADTLARGALLYFCVFQIAFVVAASSLLSFGETARYRYGVESMIWLVAALSLADLGALVRGRLLLLKAST
jgi:hypothetical protein